jgi:hypothetical protein
MVYKQIDMIIHLSKKVLIINTIMLMMVIPVQSQINVDLHSKDTILIFDTISPVGLEADTIFVVSYYLNKRIIKKECFYTNLEPNCTPLPRESFAC